MTESGRLIVVHRADFGGYRWLPEHRPGDITMVFDDIALTDLAEREPMSFDRLESWKERSAAEHHVSELTGAIAAHPAVRAIEQGGLRLIDFAEYRLRAEIVRLLRGWTLARAAGAMTGTGATAAARAVACGVDVAVGAGASEPICDPALPPALAIGVRAGLGLDPRATAYALPPALPGSRGRRAVARQLMRAVAATSRPAHMRVAAVAAGKLSLALDALSDAQLREAGVGLMPFPGLDHGNGLLLALRRRRPLLATYGPAVPGMGVSVNLPDRLGLEQDEALDRVLALLVGHVLAAAAPELDQAVRALGGLRGARELRALLLPSAAYGASRLLIEWAHERGLRVGAIQHGIYSFREFDGGDRRADVIFGWGEGTAEQVACWSQPRPAVQPVGVPGLATPRPLSREAAPAAALRRALIATSNTVDTPIAQVRFCEAFIETLAPSIERLAESGVGVELRPHPGEDPERYRRLLAGRTPRVGIAPTGPFTEALADADILISSASSVAFEAAALGVPVLLWLGPAPRWVRAEHLLTPWTEKFPGMFETAEDLRSLIADLIERPPEGFRVARELSRYLARYAEPFDVTRFANALGALAS